MVCEQRLGRDRPIHLRVKPPQPLIRFTIVFWLIQTLDLAQAWQALRELASEMAVDPAANLSPEEIATQIEIAQLATTSMVAIYGVILALLILAWAMITYATSNIARWLYSAWLAIVIVLWPFGLAELTPVEQALSVISTALCVYAVLLLHRPVMRELFGSGQSPSEAAAVFD